MKKLNLCMLLLLSVCVTYNSRGQGLLGLSPSDPAYAAAKELNITHGAASVDTIPYVRGAGLSFNDGCFINPDPTYSSLAANDDLSTSAVALPFTFTFYGHDYTSVFINNNGNITFGSAFSTYSSTGFPMNVPMVAPFWADVDTRGVGSRLLQYKVYPTYLVATWAGVGYYNSKVDKLDSFQVIITNGSDPIVGAGNNVAFRYSQMNWTTGDASGGVGGFGGTPATVGMNAGDNINYIQIGRFGANSSAYVDNTSTSGVHWLEYNCFAMDVHSADNIPPNTTGIPSGRIDTVVCGQTKQYVINWYGPEFGQTVSTTVTGDGACNLTTAATSGYLAVAKDTINITGAACNLGSHVIRITGTDNIGAVTNDSFTIVVVPFTGASASSNSPVCAGATLNLASNPTATSYSWAGPSGYSSATRNPSRTGATSAMAGVYTVTVSNGGGCTSVMTTNVVVNPTPTVSAITGTLTVNAGGTTTLSNATTGGSWSSTVPSVATVGTSGVVTGVASGTTTISYTVTNSCGTVAATANVTVASLPAGALDFNGTDMVNVPALNMVSAGGGKFTVEGWIYVNANSSLDQYIFGDERNANGGLLTTLKASRAIAVFHPAYGFVTSSAIVPLTTWTHVAFVQDATNLKLYVNGSFIQNMLTAPYLVQETGEGSTFGYFTTNYSLNERFFNGKMDEFRIWTRALCQEEIVNNMNCPLTLPQTGLRAYYKFNQGIANGNNSTVTTLADSSGNGYNGTLNTFNLTGSGSNWVAGTIGSTACSAFGGGVTAGTISGTNTVCVESTTSLSSTVSGGSWSSGNTATATVNSSGVVTGQSAGSVTISYTVTNACGTATATYAVMVNPLADPGTLSGATSVCTGSTISLSSTQSGGTWSSANGTIASVGTDGTVTGNAVGSVLISYTKSNSCGPRSVTRNINVTTVPSAATISGASSVCSGSNITLTPSASGGYWTSGNTDIAMVSESGVVSAGPAGSVLISYTLSNSCGNTTTTKSIVVNPLPDAGTISGASTVNTFATITLSSSATGGSWSSANADIATVNSEGEVTGVYVGSVLISYSVTNGCGTDVATKLVNVGSSLSTPITGTLSVCEGNTTSLANSTSGGAWSSDNGEIASVGSTGIVTGIAPGTATIIYSLAGGSVTAVVTVNANPSITGANSVCTGSSINLTSSMAGGTWTSSATGVATVGSAGTVNGVTTGSATITYTLPTGCRTTHAVAVHQTPGAITGTLTVCQGLNTTLSSTTGEQFWTSSNSEVASIEAATPTTAIVTGGAAGTATIRYTTEVGCYVSAIVTVNTTPSVTGAEAVCSGASTTLTGTPSGGTWVSGAAGVATINSTGVVTGVAAGTATMSYTLGTGCRGTHAVQVNQTPGAITGTSTLCVGSASLLSSTSSGGEWSSNNTDVASVATASGTTGLVTGVGTGTAVIRYALGAGCSVTYTVTVSTPPAGITGPDAVCMGGNITLANATSGGTWASGNTAKATIGAFTAIVSPVSAGSVVMSYIMSPTCYVTKTINVSSAPAAPEGPSSVCVGGTITLTHSSDGGTWSSANTGAATVDASGNVTGVAAGTVNINFQVAAGCATSRSIVVNAAPAGITGTASMCQGATTTLSNAGAGTWSSDNTEIATVPSTPGVVTGVAAGTANITFTLGSTGCTTVRTVSVNANPGAISGNSVICIGSTATYTNSAETGVWSMGPGSAASINSSTGVATGNSAGTTIISYTVGTCRATKPVTVTASPGSITGTASMCMGSSTTLAATPTGQTWSSDNTEVATVNASTGVVNGLTAGTATISYTNAAGCYSVKVVTVSSGATAIAGLDNVCLGGTITLTNPTSGGTWTSSTTSTATINSSGVVTGAALGTTTITYRTSATCFATKVVTVTSGPTDPITGPSTVCIGATVTLNHVVSGGTWQSNTPAKATVSADGVVTGVAAGTTRITYFTGAGCYVTMVVTCAASPATPGGTATVCEGSTVTLTITTPGGSWVNNGLNATVGSSSGIVTGVDAGTSVISYVVTATGCYSTKTVTVNATPDVIAGTNPNCIGNVQTFSTTPTGGTWASGTPGTATVGMSTGIVTGVAAGTSNITYAMSTGCKRIRMVTVNALPGAITGTMTACVGNTCTLNAATASLTWSSANASIATVATGTTITGIVTGQGVGTTTISYTNGAGCSRTVVVTITGAPAAITGASELCIGGSSTFTNSTTGGTWSSSSSNATVGASSGVVTGMTLGTANITYKVNAGCMATKAVTVVTAPSAGIVGPNGVCISIDVTFSHPTAGGTWVSSNTSRATVGSSTGLVSGISSGAVTLTYYPSPGCFTTKAINISPYVFPISGTYTVCEGATAILNNSQAGGTWSISNANATITAGTGTNGILAGVTEGTALVTYTYPTTGCYRFQEVTVNPVPTAISGASTVCVNASTTLASAPAGGTWTTSAGIYASVDAGTGAVTGVAAGPVRITYTRTNSCFAVQNMTVNPIPGNITGTAVCNELSSTTLGMVTPGGTWSMADPGIATIGATTGIATGVSTGTTTVSYTLTSTGCFRTRVFTVNPFGSRGASGSSVSGGEETVISNISVYPSPTTGDLTVETPVTGTLAVFTLDGKKLETYTISNSVTKVSLPQSLAAGVYMCRFTGDDGSSKVARIVYVK